MRHGTRTVWRIALILLLLAAGPAGEARQFPGETGPSPGSSPRSRSTAGHYTPGSTAYPSGGMRVLARQWLVVESSPHCAVADHDGTYAYFGTYFPNPRGRVVKVRLSDFTRVDALELNDGEGWLGAAAIDPAGEYAYFGLGGGTPGRVVKVDLASFTEVGALTLPDEESYPYHMLVDPAGDFLYLGLGYPGRIVKIDLVSFARVDSIPSPSSSGIGCATMDPAGEFAYFGTGSEVIKVDLATFSLAATLPISGGLLGCAVMDPAGSSAYFGLETSPGMVVKVDLATFSTVGTVTFWASGEYLRTAIIDADGEFACFGATAEPEPPRIERIDLASFSWAGSAELPTTARIWSMAIDPAGAAAYVGLDSQPGEICKVDLAEFACTDTLHLEGEAFPRPGVVSADGSAGYFGTHEAPGRVARVDLAEFRRTAGLTLGAGEDFFASAVIAPDASAAYFGTLGSPGKVVKLDLATFTRVEALALEAGEDHLECAVIDPAGAFAYFGTDTNPGQVVKIDLDSFSRTGALTLLDGESGLKSAVIDPAGDHAYFGTDTSPGRVVKIDLASFSRIGQVVLATGENLLRGAVMAPGHNIACFGTHTTPAYMVKIDLVNFQRQDSIALPSPEEAALWGAAIDPTGTWALFGTDTSPGRLVKIDLAGFARAGALELGSNEGSVWSVVPDPGGTYAYCCSTGTHGWLSQVAISHKGQLKASRFVLPEAGEVEAVHFFSHAASGNVRLALYSNTDALHLLWESEAVPNVGASAELVVPIEAGSPAYLALDVGAYWAAWQVDTTVNVASYTAGTTGDGRTFAQPFGPAPELIPFSESETTSEVWTEFISYLPFPATPTPTSLPTTATPTSLPTTATPTSLPTTATPTAVPTTATPTAVPTAATPTPAPTTQSTATPGFSLGVRIDMPAFVRPGQTFFIDGWLRNPGPPLAEVPTFFVLDVFGDFYFWPIWSRFRPPDEGTIACMLLDLPAGEERIEVVPAFAWPEMGAQEVHGLALWGAMLNDELTALRGECGLVVWGYGP